MLHWYDTIRSIDQRGTVFRSATAPALAAAVPLLIGNTHDEAVFFHRDDPEYFHRRQSRSVADVANADAHVVQHDLRHADGEGERDERMGNRKQIERSMAAE